MKRVHILTSSLLGEKKPSQKNKIKNNMFFNDKGLPAPHQQVQGGPHPASHSILLGISQPVLQPSLHCLRKAPQITLSSP